MPAPYRVYPPGAIRSNSRRHANRSAQPQSFLATRSPQVESISTYLDRLMKMLPAEVLSLYLVGSGIIPEESPRGVLLGWFILCLIGVIALRVWGTSDKDAGLPVDWWHVTISAVAFIIWVYTIGGPFKLYGVHVEYIGSLLVLAWTFFVPLFYKGQKV